MSFENVFMDTSLLADSKRDIPAIAKWYLQEWAYKSPAATLENVTEKVALSANSCDVPIAFVAHIAEALVGVGEIKYRELPEHSGFNYWLDGVYVPELHRGKGISTALINYAKRKAFELNISTLYLSCEAHNVKLYEKHGFEVVKTAQDKFIMACSIFAVYSGARPIPRTIVDRGLHESTAAVFSRCKCLCCFGEYRSRLPR